MLRVESGELDMGKLALVDAVADDVAAHRVTPADGVVRLHAIVAGPAEYGRVLSTATGGVTSAALAVFFGGSLADVAVAGAIGLLLGLLAQFVSRSTDQARVLELVGAAFGAFFYNVLDADGESYMLFTLSGAPREAFERFGMPRKTPIFGPTFAGEGVLGIVPGSMATGSYIVRGLGNPESFSSCSHGAGRVMSRSQAAGRIRRRTAYECSNRDCDFSVPAKEYEGQHCPRHPQSRMRKVRTEQVTRPGKVDWDAVQRRLGEKGIVLLGGAADEAPEVYKRLPEVLDAHAGSIRVKHTLRPLGVAMAARDIFDPYKD